MKLASVAEPGLRARVSAAEWQTRVELAACYRLVARYGMSDMIYNHITAKVPDEAGHFLINPMGFLYEEMTASCFCTPPWQSFAGKRKPRDRASEPTVRVKELICQS